MGHTGHTGTKGDQGDTGAQGAKGPTGATGDSLALYQEFENGTPALGSGGFSIKAQATGTINFTVENASSKASVTKVKDIVSIFVPGFETDYVLDEGSTQENVLETEAFMHTAAMNAYSNTTTDIESVTYAGYLRAKTGELVHAEVVRKNQYTRLRYTQAVKTKPVKVPDHIVSYRAVDHTKTLTTASIENLTTDTVNPELDKIEIRLATSTDEKDWKQFRLNVPDSPQDWTALFGATDKTYEVRMTFNEIVNHNTVALHNQGFTVTEPTANSDKLLYNIKPTSGSSTTGFGTGDYLFFPKQVADVTGNVNKLWPNPDQAAPTNVADFTWYQKLGTAEEFVVTYKLVETAGKWYMRIDFDTKYELTLADLGSSTLKIEDASNSNEEYEIDLDVSGSVWTIGTDFIQSPENLKVSSAGTTLQNSSVSSVKVKKEGTLFKHAVTKNQSKALSSDVTIQKAVPVVTPILKANNSDTNFVVSASSKYEVGEEAYHAFDGSNNTAWWPKQYSYDDTTGYPHSTHGELFDPGNGSPKIAGSWLKIQLNEAKTITSYTLNVQVGVYTPTDWKLYGSNNGENYTEIHSKSSAVLEKVSNQFDVEEQTWKYFVFHVTKKRAGDFHGYHSIKIVEFSLN